MYIKITENKAMQKVAMITGCASGIGRELALELAGLKWTVAATDLYPEKLRPLEEAGCLTFPLDVTNNRQIGETVEQIIDLCGHIDLLFNNAGYGLIGPAVDIPLEKLERQFRTNFFGPVEIIHKVVPFMKARGKGTIVNMGSISGITPTPFAGAYCSSKAAVHAWSDSLRMELKPFGIKVVIVQPGGIRTEFGQHSAETVSGLLKPESWYAPIEPYIYKRAHTSQEKATPVTEFCSRVIRKIISENPPPVVRCGKRRFFLPLYKRILPENLLDKMMMKKYGLVQLA